MVGFSVNLTVMLCESPAFKILAGVFAKAFETVGSVISINWVPA